jgi:hypothetical protein
MSEKSRLCAMTQEEVDSYLKENNIGVLVTMEHGFNEDGDWAEVITDDEGYQTGFGDDCVRIEKMWGFSSPNGFHTFDFPIDDEVKAQYMTVLFHKLYEEYDVAWSQAEALAYAYVTSDLPVPYCEFAIDVEQPPMTEEEQEAVRKRMLDCIESGNVVIPEPIQEAIDEGRVTITDSKSDT